MKTLDEMIEVMQAFKSGKKIEYLWKGATEWEGCENPIWNWYNADYRIKEEPKLRPWTYEEAGKYVGRIIKSKSERKTKLIHSVYYDAELVQINGMMSDYVMQNFTLEDGSPCGVCEE